MSKKTWLILGFIGLFSVIYQVIQQVRAEEGIVGMDWIHLIFWSAITIMSIGMYLKKEEKV